MQGEEGASICGACGGRASGRWGIRRNVWRGLHRRSSLLLRTTESGMSEDEILSDFPDLEREDIRAALAFAADWASVNDSALFRARRLFDWTRRRIVRCRKGLTRTSRYRRPSASSKYAATSMQSASRAPSGRHSNTASATRSAASRRTTCTLRLQRSTIQYSATPMRR